MKPPSRPVHRQQYVCEWGWTWEYEQAAMGDPWPGHWIVVES